MGSNQSTVVFKTNIIFSFCDFLSFIVILQYLLFFSYFA